MPAAFVTLRFVFYNLRVGRAQWRVRAELRALALIFRPKVLAGCEAVGYRLPQIPGYVLIRDTSTPGRDNLFAYVRANRRISKVRWFDMTETWARTEHPGTHPARAYLEVVVEVIPVLVGHHAPVTPGGPGSSFAARQEGHQLLVDRLSPEDRRNFDARPAERQQILRWRPEVALLDWNAAGDSPVAPAAVARLVGGRPVGEKIDAAVVRNAEVVDVDYVKRAGIILLGTDHPWGAFVLKVRVSRRWWPKR